MLTDRSRVNLRLLNPPPKPRIALMPDREVCLCKLSPAMDTKRFQPQADLCYAIEKSSGSVNDMRWRHMEM